jgi:hypothetical protein
MQVFKSKAPDLIGFQWVEGISVKDKLVELIGHEDFQLTSDEDMGLVFLEHGTYYMDIFPGDWVLKYPDGSILSMEPEELYESYAKVC